MTLVELMIVIGILAAVMLAVTGILMSASRVESRTVRRAQVQGESRQALALMTTELRQTGLDPSNPPTGTVGIIGADSQMVHVRADLDANGVIATTEPSEDVTYTYDAVNQAITRNPGSGAAPILANVTGMSLSYFDEGNVPVTPLPLSVANAARVRSIGVTITCENRDSQPITLTSRIALRNL